jgi:hypothetical protein
MSKRGLFTRHYVPNQTLVMVNTRLLQGILAAGNGAATLAPEAARHPPPGLYKNIENNPMQRRTPGGTAPRAAHGSVRRKARKSERAERTWKQKLDILAG